MKIYTCQEKWIRMWMLDTDRREYFLGVLQQWAKGTLHLNCDINTFIDSPIHSNQTTSYKVIQILRPPSTEKSGRLDMKSMTQHQNIFNLKIICQIWRRQTYPFLFFTIIFKKKSVWNGVYIRGI